MDTAIDTTTEVRLRGSLCATEVIGEDLNLWFDSPTGDTSDSLIYKMPCRSEAEAREIETLHRKAWGLGAVNYEEFDAHRKEQARRNAEDTSEDLW